MSRDQPRGRGAGHNPVNRYHRQQTTPFDDGWDQQPVAEPRTRVKTDHSRKAISYNQSPDIPFDRSVNPYRGCEHGCIYCYARPTHAWLDLSPGLDFESRLFARPGLPDRLRDELADRLAPGVLDLLKVPGLGPKKVHAVVAEQGDTVLVGPGWYQYSTQGTSEHGMITIPGRSPGDPVEIGGISLGEAETIDDDAVGSRRCGGIDCLSDGC